MAPPRSTSEGRLQRLSRAPAGPGARRAEKRSDASLKLPDIHKSQSVPQLPSASLRSRATVKAQQLAGNPVVPTGTRVSTVNIAAQREVKRRVLETLTQPNVKSLAQKIFMQQQPDRTGNLGPDERRKALRVLNEKLGIPMPSNQVAEQLFKRFDFNGDGRLNFDEFYELFVSSLRRFAFDRSAMLGRDVFVSKQVGKVWDTYSCLKKLGTGSFGAAYLAQHKRTGDHRVVKAAGKSQVRVPVEDVEREIMVMQQLDHPHVVRLYEWYEGSNSIYLVMDALSGGTLHDVVLQKFQERKNVSEEWIRTVMCQSIEAMTYCHSQRIIHKDLKDENIMLLQKDPDYTSPHAVIIDLGVSEMFGAAGGKGRSMGGTPTTMAPEVWTGIFGPKCDVWSLGCVLYELLAGDMPFCARSFDPKDWRALHKRGPKMDKVNTSSASRDMVRTMLSFSELERPSMATCLKHVWFSTMSKDLGTVLPDQLAGLKRFSETSALKRAVLFEIAARLPMKSAARIVKFFIKLDENSDGTLDKGELARGMQHIGLKDAALVDKIFNALDVDGDGILSLNEFSAGVLTIYADLLEERFRALFRRYDEDSDGYLDRKELRKLLASSMPLVTKDVPTDPDKLLDEVLEGTDGTLSYQEVKTRLLG